MQKEESFCFVAEYIIFHIIEVAGEFRQASFLRLNLKGMIDMNIHTYGTDERLGFCREYLIDKEIAGVRDLMFMPIPTSRDGATVGSSGKKPDEAFGELPQGTVAVGYGIPKSFREYFFERGITAADVSLDEDFVRENAILTAEGTLGIILTEHKSAPRDLSVGIVGYGRIGKALLNMLAFLGARPTVFTTRPEVAEELSSLGISGVHLSDGKGACVGCFLEKLDILVNTAPSPLLTADMLGNFKGAEILELASGNNFPESINITRLSALPAKMYPKSAGKALAESVLRILG